MKKNIILISLILLSYTCWAQDYKLFSVYENGKMKLKWITENVNQNKNVDVYKNNNGSWEKLNTEVIKPSPIITIDELNSNNNPFKNDKSYQDYIEFKNKKEKEANKKAYADYLFAISSIFDNQLAFHRGIYFEDNKVVKNQKYQYKVVDSETQKTLAETSTIASEPTVNSGKISFLQKKQDVSLTWKVEEEYIGYNLYRNGTKINDDPIFPSFQNNQYTIVYEDKNLKPNTYTYQIKAITFFGTETLPSDEQSFLIKDETTPSLIKNFEGSYTENKIMFKWNDEKSKDVQGYHIYKSENKGKSYIKVNQNIIPFGIKSYEMDTNPEMVNTLFFQLEIVGKNGNSNKTMPISVFVPDLVAPTKPKDFSGRAEKGKITLTWKANSEKDILGYRIYRGLKNDDKNDMLLLNETPIKSTTYSDVFPEKAGTKFIYKIAAIDQSFNISETAEAWIQLPDVIPPNAPVLLDAQVENKLITLKWTPILNDSIVGYDVYKMENERTTKITDTPVTSTTFTVRTEWSNETQFYVVAIDAANLVSEPSNKIAPLGVQIMSEIKLEIDTEVNSNKLRLKLVGIPSDEIDEIVLLRKQANRGFMPIIFDKINEYYYDNTAENGQIYEYFAQVITISGIMLNTDILSYNFSY